MWPSRLSLRSLPEATDGLALAVGAFAPGAVPSPVGLSFEPPPSRRGGHTGLRSCVGFGEARDLVEYRPWAQIGYGADGSYAATSLPRVKLLA
jgi:hypothetical protein